MTRVLKSPQIPLVLVGLALASPATAHDDQRVPSKAGARSEEVTIVGERIESSASELHLSGEELLTRPRRRPQDLLEAVPGLVTASHAGGGKASQYFLRGFDLDHGTDAAFFVENMPVNQVSHGHGQGYTDLNFLIPELVQSLDVYKGSAETGFGDFATAGTLRFGYADSLPKSSLTLSVGQLGVLRGLGILSTAWGGRSRALLALEGSRQDGPFVHPEAMEKLNGVLRVTHELTPTTRLQASVMAYQNRWNASGQIPLREVEAGRLSRFDSIDPSEGGNSTRYSLSTVLRGSHDQLRYELGTYGILSELRLDSNFTYFLANPLRGDGIRQLDSRSTFGGHAEGAVHHHEGRFTFRTRAGLSLRYDSIKNGLFFQEKGEVYATALSTNLGQLGLGPYLEEELSYAKFVRVRAGARLDYAAANVRDLALVEERSVAGALLSPKASLTLSPLSLVDLFVSGSRGFHSNDARGVALGGATRSFLVPANNYELGLALRPLSFVELRTALFRLDLDSEQVFVGDEGTTEPKGASSRHGVELSLRASWRDTGRCDASLAFTRAYYKDDPRLLVALAPTQTLSAGCDASLASGTYGAFRVRHLGSRPATEDGSISAPGYSILSLRIGQRFSLFDLSLDLDNVTNEEYREVQFYSTTRLAREPRGVDGIQFVPGWPFSARLNLSASF